MIEDLPDVPPALVLLLREFPHCSSWDDMRKRVTDMLGELRYQSEIFESNQISRPTDSRASGRFEVHLHGATDLLSKRGCPEFRCRVAAAKRISRSVGLIADRVWLTDLLTEQFVDFGEPTEEKIDDVISEIIVLAELLPLITAGVVRFRSPWVSACQSCTDYFYSEAERTSVELTETFIDQFRIEKRPDGGFNAHTGICVEPTIVYRHIPTHASSDSVRPTVREWAQEWVYDEVVTALWSAREAALTGGSVFSNSRVGLASMLKQEGRLSDFNTLALLDRERSITIPWVSELEPSQVLELRSEASLALPRFREMIARALRPPSSAEVGVSSNDVISDLRAQAAEVRAELDVARNNSSRFWKVTYGILGLSISAYGIGTDQVVAGVGGLLPILQLLIDHKSGHESDIARLTAKPGFVLMKAQDILAHDHPQRNGA